MHCSIVLSSLERKCLNNIAGGKSTGGMDDLINLADVMLSVIEGPYKVCTHYRVFLILYQANKKTQELQK